MAPLSHPNLVGLMGACWKDGPDRLCLVLEFCSHGTLNDLLKDKRGGYTWADPFWELLVGVAECMKYLHHSFAEPVIHRDLKCDNVLVTEQQKQKLVGKAIRPPIPDSRIDPSL